MSGEIIARGLQFPEGPVWLDGMLYVVEILGGSIARVATDGSVERIASLGGGPNGATLGADGTLYVAQNGGKRRECQTTPGILRVTLDGSVEMLAEEVDGIALETPNDLCFGPDGRLYFTDPRGVSEPSQNDKNGRLFAWDLSAKKGELVEELGPVFPNGIGFDADGTLLWTESFTRRVMALRGGKQEVIIELPKRHFPDGFCLGADGRLYVASTYAHCVSVVEGGKIVERLMCGDGMVTNCCIAGEELYVTESRHGTVWRFAIGQAGLPLHSGVGCFQN